MKALRIKALKLVMLSAVLLSMTMPLCAEPDSSLTKCIENPLTLSKQKDMQFGAILSTRVMGTLVLKPDGSYANPEGTLVMMPGLARVPAAFTVQGRARSTFSIILPGSTIINFKGPHNSMTIDEFTSNLHSGTGTLNRDGIFKLMIGATLHVGANQAVGKYKGTFIIGIAYN